MALENDRFSKQICISCINKSGDSKIPCLCSVMVKLVADRLLLSRAWFLFYFTALKYNII